MSDKKEQYRVTRPWVGGPELGAVIDAPIHNSIRANVELVRGKVDESDKSTKILEQARNEATGILGQARSEAQDISIASYADREDATKILEQARIDVDKILGDAKAEAEKIIADASKLTGNRR